MTKVIVTGATGTAGSAILENALSDPSISHVTVLSRRAPFVPPHEKLTTILLPSDEYPKGFDEIPPALLDRLKDHRAIIWALGISQTKVSAEQYIKITYDYTMAAARALSTLGTPGEPFRFVYISGEGADQTEKSRMIFSRTKGKVEKALMGLESESFKTLNLRPGGIRWTKEHTPHVGTLERVTMGLLGGLFNTFYPSMLIESTDLARVAVDLALKQDRWTRRNEQGVMNNVVIRELAAQLHG